MISPASMPAHTVNVAPPRPAMDEMSQTPRPMEGETPVSSVGGSAVPQLPAPKITDTVLDNGVHVVVEEIPGAETADIAIGLRKGSANDPANKLGINNILGQMMMKGTKTRDASVVRREIAAQGGATAITPGKTSFLLSGSVASEEVGTALDLYADMFMHPSKSYFKLKDAKNMTRDALKAEATPELAMAKEFPKLMFGDQPIANPISGTADSVKKIHWWNLWSYAHKGLVGNNVVVSYSGDPAALDMEKIKNTIGTLPAGKKVDNTDLFKGHREGPLVEVIPDNDSKQVDVKVGFEGYRQDDPRAAAGMLAASVLGGGFGSKLWTRLREKEQVTYGVYAASASRPLYGMAQIQGKLNPDKLRQAFASMVDEIQQAQGEGMTNDDIELARKREISSVMLEAAQPGAGAAETVGSVLSDQPVKTVEQKVAELSAVTPEQVRSAMKELFDFNNVKILARGPITGPEDIQGGLDDAKTGVALTIVPFDAAGYGIGGTPS